ncbi:MAG: isoprenyl transferase [Lentisphaerales bacterium]|nr:MAG: isoprenyl transferase [Lentisphaerales bacterium]
MTKRSVSTEVKRNDGRAKHGNTPRHVAIIMDGNGRWAEKHGLPRISGHEEGAKAVRAVLRAAKEAGVKYLTLYAFSVENWSRPKSEIDGLMRLLRRFVQKNEDDLHKNQIRLRIIGRTEDLPEAVQQDLAGAMERTAHYSDSQLILALSYGGRAEITDAARRMAARVKAGELEPGDITESAFAEHLYAPDIPDPDLMIRTSGEYRLSNFLLWQLSYAEFYVTDVLWPDFREADFQKAMKAYAERERRFGDVR